MLLFLVVSVIGYAFFIRTQYFQNLLIWTQHNIILYCLLLLCLKIIGIVYAPIPGGLFTLGSIPLIGWKLAYLIDFVGSMIGASIAYFIGRKYGYVFLTKLFSKSTIEKIKAIKVRKYRETEAIFVLRILTGSSIVDAVCYAAGLLGIRYWNFILGSILSHLIVGILTYALLGNFLSLKNLSINFVVLILTIGILYRIKGRYFE